MADIVPLHEAGEPSPADIIDAAGGEPGGGGEGESPLLQSPRVRGSSWCTQNICAEA